MAASTAMGKQCAGVFSDIAALGDRLKTIIHDSVLFQVENGIDYIFSSKLNTQLIAAIDTAGRNSVSSSSSTMAGDLFQNAKSAVKEMSTEMGKCKQAFDTSDADGWTPELETKFFVLWKGLAFKISRLSLLVLERAVDVRLLLGGTSDNGMADNFPSSASEVGPASDHSSRSSRSHFSLAEFVGWHRRARADVASPPILAGHNRVASDTGPRRVLKKKTLPLSSGRTSLPAVEAGPSSNPFLPPPAYSTISGVSSSKPIAEKKPAPSIVVDPPQRPSQRSPWQSPQPSSQPPSEISTPRLKATKSTFELSRPRPKTDNGINGMFNPYTPYSSAHTIRGGGQNYTPSSSSPSVYSSPTMHSTPTPYSAPQFALSPNMQPGNNHYYVSAHTVNVYPHASPLPPQQPYYQPYPPQAGRPLVYKSSAWSLRESAVGLLMDIVKPETRCIHNIRHFKGHPPCVMGCCWSIGCGH